MSELTIREHCDSIRNQVDMAREIAIENIHKASNALMTEIDAYESECLSSWSAAKEFTEVNVKDASKRMRAFLDEHNAFLQTVQASYNNLNIISISFSVCFLNNLSSFLYTFLSNIQASEVDLMPRLNDANKLAQELSDRKKKLKATMFDNKLASFMAFPSIDEASLLGELAFTHIQLPFKSLDIAEFKRVDISTDYGFLLPLEHGERIVSFTWHQKSDDDDVNATLISCFDRLGRLIGTDNIDHSVSPSDVTECGPTQFAVHYNPDSPKLCVYNSSLQRLFNVSCKRFSAICGNSKFVFGLWDKEDASDSDDDDNNPDNDDGNYEHDDDEYDDDEDDEDDAEDDDDDDEDKDDDVLKELEYSNQRIQAHHLDTLSKAFVLCVPDNYFIVWIMADEHHLVAMSQMYSEGPRQPYMSVFDLQAICRQIGDDGGGKKTRRNIFLAERHVRLDIELMQLSYTFLIDGWLVVPSDKKIFWFDKMGQQSEVSTEWDSKKWRAIFSYGSSLILILRDGTFLLKQT